MLATLGQTAGACDNFIVNSATLLAGIVPTARRTIDRPGIWEVCSESGQSVQHRNPIEVAGRHYLKKRRRPYAPMLGPVTNGLLVRLQTQGALHVRYFTALHQWQ